MTPEQARGIVARVRGVHLSDARKGELAASIIERAELGASSVRLSLTGAEVDWLEALGYGIHVLTQPQDGRSEVRVSWSAS